MDRHNITRALILRGRATASELALDVLQTDSTAAKVMVGKFLANLEREGLAVPDDPTARVKVWRMTPAGLAAESPVVVSERLLPSFLEALVGLEGETTATSLRRKGAPETFARVWATMLTSAVVTAPFGLTVKASEADGAPVLLVAMRIPGGSVRRWWEPSSAVEDVEREVRRLVATAGAVAAAASLVGSA